MSALPRCPACGREGATKDVTGVSPKLEVKYFRCMSCEHVWVTLQGGRIAHHVTPLKDEKRTG